MRFVEDLRVERGDILIAGAGQIGPATLFGRSLVADSRLAGKLAAGDLMVLRGGGSDDDNLLYLAAFLRSEVGVAAVRSCAYGTSIPRMRPDLLAQLPVPLPDSDQKRRIAALMRTTVEQREQYALSLKAARRVIEDLPEMREAYAMCADRRARCITWSGDLPTINAWTFASTGGAFGLLLKRWSARLGDLVPAAGIFRGNRFARIPCRAPHGADLLSQRDVFLVRPIPQRVLVSNHELAQLTAPVGSLLVGGQGTLGEGEVFGRVVLVTSDIAGKAITEHLLRIQPSSEHQAKVYAFLSTLVGLRLLRSAAVGTKLLGLRPDILRRLPVPELSAGQERIVAESVREAMAARNCAAVAEADAARVVENEVLAQWLA
jgi:hypothetical protein